VSKLKCRRWDLHLSPECGVHGVCREILETLFEEKNMSIWTILFVILLIAWITGFSVFHVAGGLIHLLLVFAVISLILHFVMGRSAA